MSRSQPSTRGDRGGGQRDGGGHQSSRNRRNNTASNSSSTGGKTKQARKVHRPVKVEGGRRHRNNNNMSHENESNNPNQRYRDARRQNTYTPPSSQRSTFHRRRNNNNNNTNNNRRNIIPPKIKPVKVSSSSIHFSWKKELGGLIRYYLYALEHNPPDGHPSYTPAEAQSQIETFYYQNGCNIDKTKEAILEALHPNKTPTPPEQINFDGNQWMNLSMILQNPNGPPPHHEGTILSTQTQQCKGLAHKGESWTQVLVPREAMNQSYYFRVKNLSNMNLSAEITIDGHAVATNAPIPANSTRTIRPNNLRYYERHEWRFAPAQRTKFAYTGSNGDTNVKQEEDADMDMNDDTPGTSNNSSSNTKRRTGQRYNGKRPTNTDTRLPLETYPDPTTYGWTFTGSVQESRVEFFEQKTSVGLGTTIKLDWYYTTGTIKTVLEHPTTGKNELFRNTVTSGEYVSILTNPRVHTGRGYRSRENRGADRSFGGQGGGNDNGINEVDLDNLPDFDEEEESNENMDQEEGEDENMNGNGANNDPSNTTYYAKNEYYNFKKDGHTNRHKAMHDLRGKEEYRQWEEAVKKDYACVHAKFFISIPQKRYGNWNNTSNNGRNRGDGGQAHQKLDLPEQAHVMDLKATEDVGLGTKFHSIGPNDSNNGTSFQRSNVRMNKIQGLNDEREWKSSPLFECKLYYREEQQEPLSEDDELEKDEDEMNQDNETNGDTMEEEDMTIQEYRKEKIDQVRNYFIDMKRSQNTEDARDALKKCEEKILLCDNVTDIDELVKIFHDNLIRGHFYGPTATGP